MKHFFAVSLLVFSFAASSVAGIKSDLLGKWEGTESWVDNGTTGTVVRISVTFNRHEVTGLKMVMRVSYPGLGPAVLTGWFNANGTFRSTAVVDGSVVARTRGTWYVANNVITLILNEPSRTKIRMINRNAFSYVTVYSDDSRHIGQLTRVRL